MTPTRPSTGRVDHYLALSGGLYTPDPECHATPTTPGDTPQMDFALSPQHEDIRRTVRDFAEQVGLTPANVAVLKNGRAKAVRFSTLEAMCRVLDCQPGDLLEWVDE